MIIKDFSPYTPNKTGKPERVAINVATPTQYKKALEFLRYYFGASFPNGLNLDFSKSKSFYHGNSELLLSCFYNDITGKYELAATTKTIIKANKSFFKYDFIGNLTDFANTL